MMKHSWLLMLAMAGVASVAQERHTVTGRVVLGRNAVPGALVQLVAPGQPLPLSHDTIVIDQTRLRFSPNLAHVRPGTTVDFRNSDPIMHNVFSPARGGADFDLGTYPETESRYHTFVRPGRYLILCHVHPEMSAWVMVTQSPYTAITDEQGRFALEDVPSGKYSVVAWYRNRTTADTTITLISGPVSELVLTIRD